MSKFIFRNFPNVCAVCVAAATLFLFVFQLLAVNATRDAASERIRAIGEECKVQKDRIKALQAEKDRLCNTEALRQNISGELKDVPNENIIRVRTMSIPYGAGRDVSLNPKALAVELTELATLTKR